MPRTPTSRLPDGVLVENNNDKTRSPAAAERTAARCVFALPGWAPLPQSGALTGLYLISNRCARPDLRTERDAMHGLKLDIYEILCVRRDGTAHAMSNNGVQTLVYDFQFLGVLVIAAVRSSPPSTCHRQASNTPAGFLHSGVERACQLFSRHQTFSPCRSRNFFDQDY
ncbi:hypothetical protein EXIGLDRAFT_21811 [Exidia glandulosa HHB12029]|uniref:Uncharacterized protein n=1 Tax=Exidia glandulosa HHB12029 TaxID=1314781 RepID=A0A165QZJ9_EXIGL|nr:hypothetical protein EXIGLDRAFT_21811 [Exidia glandulosa HHB12029]